MTATATEPTAAPKEEIEVADFAIASIAPDPDQPRKDVDEDLAASIAEQGVLQPITIRIHPSEQGDVRFMIVDGERRWRGARKAGLKFIPAIFRSDAMDEATRLIRQSTFNTGKPLSPLEEAKAWRRVQELTGMNAGSLAKLLGRAKSTVGDRLALAEAPEAFHQLFGAGLLTASAGPIVRRYSEVPNKTLEKAVSLIMDRWEFEEAKQQDRAVDLATAERVINYVICNEAMREVPPDLLSEFRGLVVTVKDKKYTPDVERIKKLAEIVAARDRSKPAPKVRQPNPHNEAERKRVREARKKGQLRRAQFDAIISKFDGGIDTRWLRFVATYLIAEMHNESLRVACKVLDITPPKKKYGGNDFASAIRKRINEASAAEAPRLLLQLLLCPDLNVSPYGSSGPQRIQAAAQLTKVDLKKVKLPDEPKKGQAARGRSLPDFMKQVQPDTALAALVGEKALPRTEITKKLWAYIKKNDLQDKKERRMINVDDKLRLLFGKKKKVSMFEMTKLVSKHFQLIAK